MRRLLLYIFTMILIVVGFRLSQAATISDLSQDYPGICIDGKIIDVALHDVQIGLIVFYRVYGRWPASWHEAVSAGLFQCELPAFNGGSINPDDSSLDFVGDIFYDPNVDANKRVRLHRLASIEGYVVRQIVEDVPSTYSELYPSVDREFGVEYYSLMLAEDNLLRLQAIGSFVRQNIHLYKEVHGSFPSSFTEFLHSGLGPISDLSINPVTGSQFFGDGREFDFYYEQVMPDSYVLIVTGDSGAFPAVRLNF